jgi:hypothetical protein
VNPQVKKEFASFTASTKHSPGFRREQLRVKIVSTAVPLHYAN